MERPHYLISTWWMNTPLMMKYNACHIKVPLEKPAFLPPQLQRDTDEGLLSTHSQLINSADKENCFFVPNREMQPIRTSIVLTWFSCFIKCLCVILHHSLISNDRLQWVNTLSWLCLWRYFYYFKEGNWQIMVSFFISALLSWIGKSIMWGMVIVETFRLTDGSVGLGDAARDEMTSRFISLKPYTLS